jgi:hypothetical protein
MKDLQDLLHVCEREFIGLFCELVEQLIWEFDVWVRLEFLLPVLGILPSLASAGIGECAGSLAAPLGLYGGTHYFLSNLDGRLERAGSRRSKWFVVPICHQYCSIQVTYQEETVISLNTVDFVKEERSVHVGDQGVKVLQDQETWRLEPSSRKDLFYAGLVTGPISWVSCYYTDIWSRHTME